MCPDCQRLSDYANKEVKSVHLWKKRRFVRIVRYIVISRRWENRSGRLCGFQDQGCCCIIRCLLSGIWCVATKRRKSKELLMIKTRLGGVVVPRKKVYRVYDFVAVGSPPVAGIGSLFYRRFTGTGSIPGSNRTDHWVDNIDFSSGCGDPIYLWTDGSKVFLSGVCGCKADSAWKDLWENVKAGSFLQWAGILFGGRTGVAEGVEQLETYFGKYLPQLFYSLIAPLTLFIILCRVSLKASVILLICVPLIPISIVVVQKVAKRLLNLNYSRNSIWSDNCAMNLKTWSMQP